MWRINWLFKTLLLALVGCTAPAPQRSSLHAGYAVADLTPDWPVSLGGYGARLGQRSRGVHDHVLAKALYLESGSTRIVLVTTDLIGSLRSIREAVRAHLPADVHVLLSASHTHSAPSALVETKHMLLTATIGTFDRRLFEWYQSQLVSAVQQAIANRAPAQLSIGSGRGAEFSRNRRSSHYPSAEAPTDPEIGVLRVGDVAVVNFAAHPTVLDADNFLISADWPGALQRHLEKTGVRAMFTNGAEGDLSPVAPNGQDAFEECELLGAALAKRVSETELSVQPVDIPLRYLERRVDLPKNSGLPWVKETVLGVLQIGDAILALVPGELSCELGLELKRRYREMGWHHAWIVGLANDHLFYILSEEQYRKGGYERNMSFYGPRLGPWLVEQFTELGAELKRTPR